MTMGPFGNPADQRPTVHQRSGRVRQQAAEAATVGTSGNKERIESRQLFLTIESDDNLVIAMRPDAEQIAGTAAAKFNAMAKVGVAA